MELKLDKISGNSYIVAGDPRSPTPGLVVNDNNQTAILIDSGLHKDFAKEIDKTIIEASYKIVAIINTHHHPDHHGGNAFFQNKYPDLKIFATEYEKVFIENSFIEPLYLNSGAQPFNMVEKSLFFNTTSSAITNVIPTNEENYIIQEAGIELEVVPLPGHTPGMIGIGTADGVLYCADALFGESILDKFGLLYHTYIKDTLETLAKIDALSTRYPDIALYHGGKIKDRSLLIEKNRRKIIQTRDFLLDAIKHKSFSVDELTALTMRECETLEQAVHPARFILNKTIVTAFLSDLEQSKLISIGVDDGMLRVTLNSYESEAKVSSLR